MDTFVIITVEKTRGHATRAITLSWRLTLGPDVNREGLFNHVVTKLLPEEHRGGVILFYSAELLSFGSSTAAAPLAASAPQSS